MFILLGSDTVCLRMCSAVAQAVENEEGENDAGIKEVVVEVVVLKKMEFRIKVQFPKPGSSYPLLLESATTC